MLLLVTFSCLLLRPCSSLHPGANSAAEGGNVTTSQRALSVFSVVKVRLAAACCVLVCDVRIVCCVQFPNSACSSSTAGRNGTCYTSSECTSYR